MTSNSSRGESRPSPLSRLWSGSTAMVRRGLGMRPSTEEEIQVLLQEGRQAGVFGEAEHEMVKRVFRLGDLRSSELMRPMREVVWLDVADPPEEMQHKIAQSPHSRFPVCEGSIDNVLGIVQIKDLLVQGFNGQPFGIKGLLKMPLFLYEGTPILKVLESFQKTGTHIAAGARRVRLGAGPADPHRHPGGDRRRPAGGRRPGRAQGRAAPGRLLVARRDADPRRVQGTLRRSTSSPRGTIRRWPGSSSPNWAASRPPPIGSSGAGSASK